MRFLAIFILAVTVMGAGAANAADEFGQRFGSDSPAALQEKAPDTDAAAAATAPQNIEPAAGDESDKTPDARKDQGAPANTDATKKDEPQDQKSQ